MQRAGGTTCCQKGTECILLGAEGIFVRTQEADSGENEAQGKSRMALVI